MIEKTTIRSNLELPSYGVLGAVIVLLPTMIFGHGIGALVDQPLGVEDEPALD